MATIQVPNLATQHPRHNTALGNMIVERYQLQVTAGLVNGVDIATGDVIILGILPAGWRLMPQFAKIVVSDAFGTGVTGTVGFAYIDGVDDTAVPQDADYFLLSNTLAARPMMKSATKRRYARGSGKVLTSARSARGVPSDPINRSERSTLASCRASFP